MLLKVRICTLLRSLFHSRPACVTQKRRVFFKRHFKLGLVYTSQVLKRLFHVHRTYVASKCSYSSKGYLKILPAYILLVGPLFLSGCATQSSDGANSQLRTAIGQEAASHYIAPTDARIEPPRQAIPGYDGRQVDEEATYKKTLESGDLQKIQWIYRAIPPKVTLEDLGPVPIYRGNEQKKAAAIMVNVSWGEQYLPDILQILKDNNVKATFFLDGSWVAKHPTEAMEIVSAGHEIGNHAYTHPLFSKINDDKIKQEIDRTNQEIEKALHKKVRFFAPPAGDFDQRTLNIAAEMGLKVILWSADTIDWKKDSTPQRMVGRIEKKLAPGILILTHPTDRTVIALPEIIRTVKDHGLQLMTVGELLSSKRQ